MTQMLTDRYHERLAGTLSCYDRIVITGTLPGACYAAGMTSFLNAKHIRIFDYPRFAEPLRDRIREAAQVLATAQGARIEHVAKAHIRKEDLVAAVLKDRGDHPGLVHVLSAGQRFRQRADAEHQHRRQHEISYLNLRSLTHAYSKTPRAENSAVISSLTVSTTRMDTKDDRGTYSTSIDVTLRARPRSRLHSRHGDCPIACLPPERERVSAWLFGAQTRSYNSLTTGSTTMTSPSIAAQLAALRQMPLDRLRTLWDEHFPRRPLRVTRRYLESRLAYRLQEVAYGGLPKAIKEQLADCGERLSKIKVGRGAEVRLMPGTVLVREWDAREYRVTVTADGLYELDGQRYKSLSAAAKAITSTHWSGPAFFGLKGRR